MTYQWSKQEVGVGRYLGSLVGHEAVRRRFRLRTVSAGLLTDKKRCRLCEDGRCVLCDREEEEDVCHFVLKCEEFAMDRCRLPVSKYWGNCGCREMVRGDGEEENGVALLLGRMPDGIDGDVVDRVDSGIRWEVNTSRGWQRRKELQGCKCIIICTFM